MPRQTNILMRAVSWGLAACILATQAPAEVGAPSTPGAAGSETAYVGTVRARDVHGLSWATGGCIATVSDAAMASQRTTAGEVLATLDDALPQLALRTAQVRLDDLEAAVAERALAVKAAAADARRRAEEVAFVAKEFERNQAMFRRGLINETTMEGVERRMMDARFAAEQAAEALAAARSAQTRAEIAVQIGALDLATAELEQRDLSLVAPFDGVLLGFEPAVGTCVSAGAQAARVYDPRRKAVDLYVLVARLTEEGASRVSTDAEVTVYRGNGAACGGRITRIDTEADLESQYVKVTADIDEACAPALFLNEAVDVAFSGG